MAVDRAVVSGERLSFEPWTDADPGGDAGDADADVMDRRNG